MSQNSNYPTASPADVGRTGSVRIARRQLLTARASHDLPPPRVVLHLPDLDALDGVVLGPPKPAARRRVDAAHTSVPGESHAGRNEPAGNAADGQQPNLVNLLRAPLQQLAPQLGNGSTLEKIGRLLVLLQQPKVLLATVMAVGLQLAAVLAMMTGGSSPNTGAPTNTAGGNSQGVASTPEVFLPHAAHPAGHDAPIRTPATVLGSGPSLTPSLPPPQNLAGVGVGDVPPWQTSAAGNPAQPSSAVTIAPGTAATPGTQADGKPVSKPTRARLAGTIKKTPSESSP